MGQGSDVRYSEVAATFARHGWWLARVSGSHHIHTNGTQSFSVPVHNGRVKRVYCKKIKKIVGGE